MAILLNLYIVALLLIEIGDLVFSRCCFGLDHVP